MWNVYIIQKWELYNLLMVSSVFWADVPPSLNKGLYKIKPAN